MEKEYEVKRRIKVAFRTIVNQIKRWKFPVERGVVPRRSPKTLETRWSLKKETENLREARREITLGWVSERMEKTKG